MFALLAVSSVALTFVEGAEYNFDDSYFNRGLLDQMDDYFMPQREDYVTDKNPRLRKRMRFRNEICCGDYETSNMLKEDRIRDQCFDEVFNSTGSADFLDEWNYFNVDGAAVVAEQFICLQQCLWKLRGTFEERYDRATGRLREPYRGSRRRQDRANLNFPDRVVAKCLPDINPELSDRRRRGRCDRDYMDFSYCVWEEMHSNCPDKLWDSTNPWCRQIRNYLNRRRRYSKR